jgi:2-C-methyl-D-erythritol 4-phosphate cytidylyltransferase/2-C-methyl-D-erythritol 2,4-cyclodiphosphate synthase
MTFDAPAVGVVIVAAGSGSRLGHSVPKAFVELAGRSILAHSLDSVFAMSTPAQIVVVAPADELESAAAIVRSIAGAAIGYVSVVAGADTRQGSVRAGIDALDPAVETVLVHDAARAFTPSHLFDRVIAAVTSTAAGVIPGLPVVDTIKRMDAGLAVATVDRSELMAVQTPQGFPRVELEAAYGNATTEYTDDAALFAAAGHEVSVIEGDALAFKITTPWDLRRAETLAAGAESSAKDAAPEVIRTGVGLDVHAFDSGEPLWLGGLFWPDETGLAGHSDGDAVCHSMCDALLSAAGLGDVGSQFGTADPRFADAHGEVFIAATVALVTSAGWTIDNISVQVVANRPKIGARRAEMETKLVGLVGAPVSVAATTSDSLGFTGRGEGVAVISTCLLHRTR